MTIIIDGTTGISGVDGSSATPAMQGADSNTGISYGTDTVTINTGGVARVTVDSSGNLLAGFNIIASGNLLAGLDVTGSVGINLANSYNVGWGQGTGESIPNVFRQTSSAATVVANGYRNSATSNGFASSYSPSWAKTAISLDDGTIRFYTNTAAAVAAGTDVTPSERMRIDSSGNLLMGTTSQPIATGTIRSVTKTGAYGMVVHDVAGNTAMMTFIASNNAQVGSIISNTTNTSYLTSSDYRLKENVAPMQNALATVAALKPCTYNWKADGSAGQGFIAHELQEVVPDCVTGKKDAVQTVDDLDADGKRIGTKEVPQYQGVDTSFLVATLVAAIQELKADFDAYKLSHP